MRKRVLLKDIAEQANVSISLVSIVLNDKARKNGVRPEVAEKIRRVAKELNYAPNAAAKSLREGRSRTIGLIVSDISNPFFANIARHVERTAEKYGYAVHFSSSDENAAKTAMLAENMIGRGIDGIIVVPCEGSRDLIADLAERGIPLVQLDRYFPGINATHICLNNKKAGYDVTRHLIGNGYRKISMINYSFNIQHTLGRNAGYEEAMNEAGLGKNIFKATVTHGKMEESCLAAISKVIKAQSDALIMSTNTIAINCLKILSDKKMRIPEDLALVGFDGGDAFDFFNPSITYIMQPLEAIAQKAVEILIEQIEDSTNHFKQEIEYEGKLIERGSSKKL